MAKKMFLTRYARVHKRGEWGESLADARFLPFFEELAGELERYGITLEARENPEHVIEVNSYVDLLNAVRIGSPCDGISNVCVGHVIGKSENLDPLEDIRKAVNRIAFAPETVPPDDHNRRVCHNCGCGC
ncbi:hypothetical protein [Geomesophilobacter sediminis]|uniref:Uncharacterized protein n=1 Tax=Geomesophilobacter sediminis TaxID=2798584 RepID=A0A8J7M2V3_9BACT|nr:hypothetical protein [Geomesophilobacter sediminis]MBJ6727617.1 hypothetical protein [Geomesophilobacter sediminis]